MIGLSVSHCIKDILNGKVQVENVEKIIGSTRCTWEEDWDYIFERYYISYWGKHTRQECLNLLNKLRPIIEQPKLQGKKTL